MLERAVRCQMDNGLTLLACPHQATEHVEVILSLPAGTGLESPGQAGLANFVARAVLLGSAELDFDAYNEELDSFGGSLSAGGQPDSAVWRGSCLAADLPRLLELLRSALVAPAFAVDDVSRLRGQLLTGIDEREQDTMRLARRVAQELAYGLDHAYGRPANGYRTTVQTLGPPELQAFWQAHYAPRGGIVAVVGPGDPGRLASMVESALADWSAGGQQPGSVPEGTPPALSTNGGAQPGTRRDLTLPGKTQTDIAMVVPALPRDHPDYEALSLANLILGRLGLGGRLGQRVRERLGLAYYCYSSLVPGRGPGPWLLAAGVNPSKLVEALENIEAELQRMRMEPVDADELTMAVGYARGSLIVQLEEPAGLLGMLHRLEYYQLGLGYVARYLGWLETVSAERLREVVQRHLVAERIAVVTAGPPLAGQT